MCTLYVQGVRRHLGTHVCILSELGHLCVTPARVTAAANWQSHLFAISTSLDRPLRSTLILAHDQAPAGGLQFMTFNCRPRGDCRWVPKIVYSPSCRVSLMVERNVACASLYFRAPLLLQLPCAPPHSASPSPSSIDGVARGRMCNL